MATTGHLEAQYWTVVPTEHAEAHQLTVVTLKLEEAQDLIVGTLKLMEAQDLIAGTLEHVEARDSTVVTFGAPGNPPPESGHLGEGGRRWLIPSHVTHLCTMLRTSGLLLSVWHCSNQ